MIAISGPGSRPVASEKATVDVVSVLPNRGTSRKDWALEPERES